MKKSKKILIISHLYPAKSQPVRGIFVHKMNLALKRLGFDIFVVSPQVFGKTKAKNTDTIDKISVIYPKYFSFSRFFIGASSWLAYRSVRRAIRENNFDLILAHTAIPDGYIAKKLSDKFGIPFIVYVHGADVQHKINYSSKVRNLIVGILEKANKVFVNSSKTEKLVSKLGINSVVVPLGIESPVDIVKKKVGKKLRIISVCNLEIEKGIQYVIEALANMNDNNLEYVVIGDGGFRKELEKKANGDDRVKFLGRLSQDRVFKELAESDIFILPSYNEAFGVAYLEAMQMGLPIIGVEGEGIADIIKKGECGILVKPKSVASIELALKKLINNDSLRKKMGEIGQKIVNENYTWKITAKKLAEELLK